MFSAPGAARSSGGWRRALCVGAVLGLVALPNCSSAEHAPAEGRAGGNFDPRDVVVANAEGAASGDNSGGDAAEEPNGQSAVVRDGSAAPSSGNPFLPTSQERELAVCDAISGRALSALADAIGTLPECQLDQDCRPFTIDDSEICWATCGFIRYGSVEYEEAVRAAISSGQTRSECQEYWDKSCFFLPLPCTPNPRPPGAAPIWRCVEQATVDPSVTVRRCAAEFVSTDAG